MIEIRNMKWCHNDNIFYDAKGGLVYLHTFDEDFVYSIHRHPIGHGGMGMVWLGNSVFDKRMVAIKRIHDRYANILEIRNRARLEAGMKFRHENLVEMLGVVESIKGTGPIFIVSNFIQGMNIDKFVEMNFSSLDTRERERRIITLTLPIINALIYIHYYNIWHLDIKPSNIMVENGRNVRLMDLGISYPGAKPLNTDALKNDTIKRVGLMGTPRYAAPEQFRLPEFGEIGPRSDIYGLSVTLYELLAGENPFCSDSIGEAIQKHCSTLLPDSHMISSPIMKILYKGAHPDQKQRYSSVKEFGEALKNALYAPTPKLTVIDWMRGKMDHKR